MNLNFGNLGDRGHLSVSRFLSATSDSSSQIWKAVAIIFVLLMLGRFFVAWEYESWNILYVLGMLTICVILLYASFLVEGIILVASKIEEYDEDAIIRTMNKAYGKVDNINTTLLYVKQKMQDILVGQPLVAIAITLAFDAVIETVGLHVGPNGHLLSPVAEQHLPGFIVYLMSSSLVSGILSAALIYWSAQLLPQTLGKKNSIEFMRLSGASHIARALVAISKTGVGTPSVSLERLFGRRFSGRVDVPVGDARIFEALCADFGYYVSYRKITITPGPDRTEVVDEITYVYLDERIELSHSCRLAMDQFNSTVDFTLNVPDHTTLEKPNLKFFDLDISQVDDSDPTAPKLKSVYGERVHVIETSVSKSKRPEKVTTCATYFRDPLTLDPNRADSFTFDMGVPTCQIDIRIKQRLATMVNAGPILTFTSEVSRFVPKASPLTRGVSITASDADGWLVAHTYPPLSTEMRLQIDARAANISTQGEI